MTTEHDSLKERVHKEVNAMMGPERALSDVQVNQLVSLGYARRERRTLILACGCCVLHGVCPEHGCVHDH